MNLRRNRIGTFNCIDSTLFTNNRDRKWCMSVLWFLQCFSQHLACEVLTRMHVNLPRSELLFIHKMVREIIFVPRVDSGYPHNFMVDSWVFKDDESESEAKTNRGSRVCPLLVESPHFACVEYAQCLLLARARAHTHTHTHKGYSLLTYIPFVLGWRQPRQ